MRTLAPPAPAHTPGCQHCYGSVPIMIVLVFWGVGVLVSFAVRSAWPPIIGAKVGICAWKLWGRVTRPSASSPMTRSCAATICSGKLRIATDIILLHPNIIPIQWRRMEFIAMAPSSDVFAHGMFGYLWWVMEPPRMMTHVRTTQPKCGPSTQFVPIGLIIFGN